MGSEQDGAGRPPVRRPKILLEGRAPSLPQAGQNRDSTHCLAVRYLTSAVRPKDIGGDVWGQLVFLARFSNIRILWIVPCGKASSVWRRCWGDPCSGAATPTDCRLRFSISPRFRAPPSTQPISALADRRRASCQAPSNSARGILAITHRREQNPHLSMLPFSPDPLRLPVPGSAPLPPQMGETGGKVCRKMSKRKCGGMQYSICAAWVCAFL